MTNINNKSGYGRDQHFNPLTAGAAYIRVFIFYYYIK